MSESNLPSTQWWMERHLNCYEGQQYHPLMHDIFQNEFPGIYTDFYKMQGSSNGLAYVVLAKQRNIKRPLIVWTGICFAEKNILETNWQNRQILHLKAGPLQRYTHLAFIPLLEHASKKAVCCFEFGAIYSLNLIDSAVEKDFGSCPRNTRFILNLCNREYSHELKKESIPHLEYIDVETAAQHMSGAYKLILNTLNQQQQFEWRPTDSNKARNRLS